MPGDVMRTKGFTLIELMIVATILGVLLAIAFPAYHDYTIRVRVAEGLEKASFAKLAVAEKILIDNILPANQADTSYSSPVPTDNVASIAIGNQGIITITYTANAGNGTITMVPTLDATGRILTWDCTGGTLLGKYRPAYCRP
ncbi:TPA: prepilin-type N-terminal cleavage/methylation domain-containing protein [Legionella pneumophila]|nr:prepilin-type N-terminal cleavage/methylation domain-containing protein [Legionella pneumophila]HAU0854354.1 pilin [Legionella pneumophila]HAU0938893.1 pilin [Legionella pneumophila]HAU0991151.1 pilin [Legionella pneumophila]HAU2265663.1 pilin [Legionella pneumophila]